MWWPRYSSQYWEHKAKLTDEFRQKFDGLGTAVVAAQFASNLMQAEEKRPAQVWLEERRVRSAVRQRWFNALTLFFAAVAAVSALWGLAAMKGWDGGLWSAIISS